VTRDRFDDGFGPRPYTTIHLWGWCGGAATAQNIVPASCNFTYEIRKNLPGHGFRRVSLVAENRGSTPMSISSRRCIAGVLNPADRFHLRAAQRTAGFMRISEEPSGGGAG